MPITKETFWRKFASDDRGQVAVEYTLLLAVFALPMIGLFSLMLSAISHYYQMVVLFETLPFP